VLCIASAIRDQAHTSSGTQNLPITEAAFSFRHEGRGQFGITEKAVVFFVLLPLEEILLLRADSAVLQALGIVTGEDELHGAEEPLVELGPLVGKALPNAFDRVGYVVMAARLRRLIYGPEPATPTDEKRNRERSAADLEIDTGASS
jgi:hypothetical protein